MLVKVFLSPLTTTSDAGTSLDMDSAKAMKPLATSSTCRQPQLWSSFVLLMHRLLVHALVVRPVNSPTPKVAWLPQTHLHLGRVGRQQLCQVPHKGADRDLQGAMRKCDRD